MLQASGKEGRRVPLAPAISLQRQAGSTAQHSTARCRRQLCWPIHLSASPVGAICLGPAASSGQGRASPVGFWLEVEVIVATAHTVVQHLHHQLQQQQRRQATQAAQAAQLAGSFREPQGRLHLRLRLGNLVQAAAGRAEPVSPGARQRGTGWRWHTQRGCSARRRRCRRHGRSA